MPRLLSLHADGTLGFEPVPELKIVRGKHQKYENIHITPSSASMLEDVHGACLEIAAEFDPGDAEKFGLKVRCAPNGTEETLIIYDAANGCLYVPREKQSLSPDVNRGVQGGPLGLAAEETLKLHVFLDRSVIEVFANGGTCLTSRIYPSRDNSLGVGVLARGGTAKLKVLDVWEIRPISKAFF